ncbi:alpha/beta hydrolase-fold protein [Nocardia sp. NPDC059246]|uniref:alpha/beta hydrolase-fold protein n=1 Tax=unclassified Nocardia TaxID=2637762 RepID=UPI00367CEB75
MDRTVTVDVLHPADDEPRPTYYLLDGVDSGAAETNWTQKTDIVSFFADKRVNVVLPVGGKGTFYSDWQLLFRLAAARSRTRRGAAVGDLPDQ